MSGSERMYHLNPHALYWSEKILALLKIKIAINKIVERAWLKNFFINYL